MSEEKLDQIVKGAPLPEANKISASPGDTSPITTSPQITNPTDPLASLPSSPPQIYLNLLLLEASLRAQYLSLRSRRRSHTFFILLLLSWNLFFVWALFLKPREDGSGVGGSIYWVIETSEKMCLMGGVVTGVLVWGTGQWERGIRWPRRWVGTTNRGLRGFNLKVVVVKGPWWKELWETVSFIFSYGLFETGSRASSYRYISPELMKGAGVEQGGKQGRRNSGLPNIHEEGNSGGIEEDLSPGGDYIRLLLLPKPFSPSFRENWDLYRTEYWEKENDRRLQLRLRVSDYDRQQARKAGGWFWWTGWRGWSNISPRKEKGRSGDVEKSNIHHPHRPHEKENLNTPTSGKRLRSGSLRSGSHSRNSSRSSTPEMLKAEEGQSRSRRGSSGSTTSTNTTGSTRKKRGMSTRGSLRGKDDKGGVGLRSNTPDSSSPLVRGFSGEGDSEGPPTPSDGESVRSLRVPSGRGKGVS